MAFQCASRRGRAKHTAQPFQGGQRVGLLRLLPGKLQRRAGEVGKHLQALFLRLDQAQQALLAIGVGTAGREQCRTGGAFLAGEFLALHEVEQGHQVA